LVLIFSIPINYALAREYWEDSFVEYDTVQYWIAPNGFIVFYAPSRGSHVEKQTYTQAKLGMKGYVKNNEGFFYMTKWSWDQYQNGKRPNWVWIK